MRSALAVVPVRRWVLPVRKCAGLAVAALAAEAVVSGLDGRGPRAGALLRRTMTTTLPTETRVLAVLVGVALLATAPRLWRGTRTAVGLAIAGLLALATLNLVTGDYGEALLEGCLVGLMVLGRGGFDLGCVNRPRLAIVFAAVAAWGAVYAALLVGPLIGAHGIADALPHSAGHALRRLADGSRLSGDWRSLVEALLGCAALSSALALRSTLRPARSVNCHTEHEYQTARAIVARHGTDSLSPFVLRPDKALAFVAGGMLSFRVVGDTAIVSSDPVGPDGRHAQVLAGFREMARAQGWRVVVWAASDRYLGSYRRLGMHAVCAGEEAVVDPSRFTLEGRAVRKLRQSVHRVDRRGWTISAHEGRDVDAALEREIDDAASRWREHRGTLHGFAMGMAEYATDIGPDDLYVLGRGPDGRLGAVMRFAAHCENLSLDTMQRVGETPNGLNEALVARALQAARERGVNEVSLNYAGLAHLIRHESGSRRTRGAWRRLALAPLHRRFQMDRLVRFNDKFSPEWRPRYLVCDSRVAVPRAVVAVLRAEGYLPERRRPAPPRPGGGSARVVPDRRLGGYAQ